MYSLHYILLWSSAQHSYWSINSLCISCVSDAYEYVPIITLTRTTSNHNFLLLITLTQILLINFLFTSRCCCCFFFLSIWFFFIGSFISFRWIFQFTPLAGIHWLEHMFVCICKNSFDMLMCHLFCAFIVHICRGRVG